MELRKAYKRKWLLRMCKGFIVHIQCYEVHIQNLVWKFRLKCISLRKGKVTWVHLRLLFYYGFTFTPRLSQPTALLLLLLTEQINYHKSDKAAMQEGLRNLLYRFLNTPFYHIYWTVKDLHTVSAHWNNYSIFILILKNNQNAKRIL